MVRSIWDLRGNFYQNVQFRHMETKYIDPSLAKGIRRAYIESLDLSWERFRKLKKIESMRHPYLKLSTKKAFDKKVARQRHLDVAQRLAPRQLTKRHDAKLLATRQASHAGIARIAIHDASKARPGDKLHDLCKQRLAYVHGMAPRILTPGIYPKTQKQDSNRHQAKSAEKPRQNSLFKNPRPV